MLSRWADWPRNVALSIGCVVCVFSAAVLTAWAVHFIPLIQVVPGTAPLTRQGSLLELLLGAGLVGLATGRKRAAAICAAAVIIVTVLVGAEYLTGRNFAIDELLGKDYITRTSPPGRISPIATISYLSLALLIALMSTRKRMRFAADVAGLVSSLLMAMGAVAFLAYALGYSSAYGWGHFRPISILAAAVVVLLGAGIMALALEESRAARTLPQWLPLAIGLALGIGALGVWQALMLHEKEQLPLLSQIILAAGIAGAILVAIVVFLGQKATLRSLELQEGKEAYEHLFEASLDALLVTDIHGRIVNANHRVQDIFGYARDEIVGTPIETMVPNDLRHLHVVHRTEYNEAPRTRPMGKGLDLHGRRKDGSEFPVEVSLSPLRSRGKLQVLAAVADITERKQAEEALRRSEARFRGVFESSPLGLALIHNDFRLAKVNPSLCRLSGYSEAELLAMNPLDATHPDDLEESRAQAERLFRGEIPSYKMEKRYFKKNGEIIWATMTATILRDEQGRPLLGLGTLEDITERKAAQEALRQSEERFRSVVEQGPIGITLVDRSHRFIKVNSAFCRMLGYSEADLIGKTPPDITHPDDRESTVNTTEQLFTAKVPIRKVEKRYITKSGDVIWGSLSASVIRSSQGEPLYAMGMIEDITERKRAEDELRTLTQRLALATRSASLGVWEWDFRTDTSIWDDRMFEIFGIAKKAKVGREDWTRLFVPDEIRKADAFMDTIIRGKMQATQEFRFTRPDGSWRHISVTGGAALGENGMVVGVVGTAVDITERKQLEEELEAAREQAITSARLSALGMMAGGVAHEINNPLSIIHAMASDLGELVADQGLAPPHAVAHKSQVIRETAERIAKIVRSLRQISREGVGDPFRPTPLARIVGETLEICRAKFQAHGVELHLPRAIPEISIPCREVQIAQALLNLLQNAFDAVLEQKEERWVRLEVQPADGWVSLSVIDSGGGIPSEIRPRLMEPFFTTKPVGKGTGLGLSLSKTIAEDHSGSLEYGEDHGHTRFSLVLPFTRKAKAA